MSTEMFSIDKLVEFGMGVSIAQQMVKTMNYAIDNMHIPNVGAANNLQMQPSGYYVAIDSQTAGPFTDGELMQLIRQKKITKQTYLWKPGMSGWLTAEHIPEVLRLVALCPPPLPDNETNK